MTTGTVDSLSLLINITITVRCRGHENFFDACSISYLCATSTSSSFSYVPLMLAGCAKDMSRAKPFVQKREFANLITVCCVDSLKFLLSMMTNIFTPIQSSCMLFYGFEVTTTTIIRQLPVPNLMLYELKEEK